MLRSSTIRILSLAFLVLFDISGAFPSFAQQSPINDPVAHDALIKKYFTSAFASRDQLLKPNLPPTISYHCDLEFCQRIMMELKSDFPSVIQQNTVISTSIDASEVISIRFFSNDLAAAEASSKLVPLSGEQSSTLKFPSCKLTRFVQAHAVTRVIVEVVEENQIKSNTVCALYEVARGTGLDLRESYPEYSKVVSEMNNHDYARFTNGIRNFLDIHWSPNTRPGMTQTQVKEALQGLIIIKNN